MPFRVQLACNAMATRFEVVLHGEDPPHLRAASEEALDEILRVEAQLSLYRPDSEVAHLNARAAREWVRVSPELFDLLSLSVRLSAETSGAFDLTVGPLVRCWGFMGGTGGQPTPEAIAEARKSVGMHLLEFDADNFGVRFREPGVMLDFGAIGKGYAIDKAREVLGEAGVTSAIIHGGTSTVFAIGQPPDQPAWKVAIEGAPRTEPETPQLLAVVELKDEALSVSAVWGKSFSSGGKTCGHVIDPRTGQPADSADLAAVVLPSATETDAFSTALLADGFDGHDRIARLRPAMRTLVARCATDSAAPQIESRGIPVSHVRD
jgi:FAD:protein FMN transferase